MSTFEIIFSTTQLAGKHSTWILITLLAVILSLGIAPEHPAHAQDANEPQPVLYLPLVNAPASHIIISAAHIDSNISYETDEAIQLWNIGGRTQDLAGWQLSTASRRATIPVTATLSLPPGNSIWCASEERTFRQSFGEMPACVWDSAESPSTVKLVGNLALTNHGGHIQLRNAQDKLVDALLYGDAVNAIEGWIGAPAQVYARGAIGAEGQVWHRKRLVTTDQPMDTDSASDWAGDLADIDWGRRVAYPGWDLNTLARPFHSAATVPISSVTVAVAPEGLYVPLRATLASAQQSIDLSLYVFEHPHLAQTIADAAARGVRVRLLLEGSPVGGITDMQRWCVSHMAAAGADVRYLATTETAPRGYQPRYRYTHAKYGIIDGQQSFVGTENLTWDAAPVVTDSLIGGRRGFFLFSDATSVVESLTTIFNSDWQPDNFLDLHPYQPAHPVYGKPPAYFTLPPPPAYPVTSAPFARSVTATGLSHYIVVSAPENALRPDDGLFALLDRAGANDEILVAQLYEHHYWGNSHSNPVADPNPRLQRIIAAARRGARVRILLDSLYDEPEALRSNRATADYLRDLAARENLDLDVRLVNPTGGGLHGKLVLVRVGSEMWSAVGSLNGGEVSHKLNREVVLMVDHPQVYERLQEVFIHDWTSITR